MAWRIEFAESAAKSLSRLDHEVKQRVLRFLRTRIAPSENPRDFGGPLRKSLAGFWKYRVGDYRIVADIEDEKVLIVVLRIGHRRRVYGGH
ncbi:MAG: type II toxin-antitoxin system RelE family toxin [Desulfovibrionaceae bacterium]